MTTRHRILYEVKVVYRAVAYVDADTRNDAERYAVLQEPLVREQIEDRVEGRCMRHKCLIQSRYAANEITDVAVSEQARAKRFVWERPPHVAPHSGKAAA